MILVTGGTGLVGAQLLYKLASQGKRLRAIYRTKDSLNKTLQLFSYYTSTPDTLLNTIEWMPADITDIPRLSDAFVGIKQVYHCAALISFDSANYSQLQKINVEGTANIVNCCISYGIQKLCYVSSIATLGTSLQPDILIDEDTPWQIDNSQSLYSITKYDAEMEVWRATLEGVNVVIVNPGVILGPGFWKTGSGVIFNSIYKGLHYYSNSVTGYVAVEDVVNIMYLLMDSNISNERFIVVSENVAYKTLQEKIAHVLGVKPAKKKASNTILQLAWRLDWVRHKFTSKPRQFTRAMAKISHKTAYYSNSKIKNILNFNFKSIEQCVTETGKLFLTDLKTNRTKR